MKRDRRFSRFSVFAIMEVAFDRGVWHPHWHVLISHPRVDRIEVAAALRKRFPGARRVQVQPFRPENTISENVENCVRYALKFDHSRWPTIRSAQLFRWIRGRAALRSMCKISKSEHEKTKTRNTRYDFSKKSRNQHDEIEPMPMLI